MFQLGYNELKVYCPVFNEFRLITKFDHNIQCFGQCLFEDKIIMAGGLEKDPNNDLLVNSRKVCSEVSQNDVLLFQIPLGYIFKSTKFHIVQFTVDEIC